MTGRSPCLLSSGSAGFTPEGGDVGQENDDAENGRALSLGGALLDDTTLDGLLQRVVQLSLLTVEGTQAVSITVADEGRYRTSNSIGTGALAIDEVQYREGDGPCLEAMRRASPVQVNVGVDEARWPWFNERALENGSRASSRRLSARPRARPLGRSTSTPARATTSVRTSYSPQGSWASTLPSW